MLEIVTSLNQTLFDQYGRRAISEIEMYAGEEVRLNVVFEGKIPSGLPKYRRVRFVPFESAGHNLFLRRFGHLKEANGLRINFNDDGNKQTASLNWNFRYNAVRFAFKIFAIDQILPALSSAQYLVWLDADIRVLRKFDLNDLTPFLPRDHELMAYLGRTKFPKPNPYSEAGWLGFNLRHIRAHEFFNFVAQQYTTGEIFSQAEWHDSWIWDVTRLEFEGQGVLFRNISGSAEEFEHPFINCGLGTYFDHLKGPERKAAGRSFPRDYERFKN